MHTLTLQLGHPKILPGAFSPARSVADALEALFRPEEESVYLFWHSIPIRIRYRQDLPRCFDEILAMAWLVSQDENGGTKLELETQLVSMHWEVRWEVEECHVRSEFFPRSPSYEAYAAALNARPDVRMGRNAFLREWSTLLHQIVVSVEAGEIEIIDGTERRKWELLQRVESGIEGYGVLYTRPS